MKTAGIFRPKTEELTGGWSKMLHEGLHSCTSTLRVIKSRTMRWARHVECMEEMSKFIQTFGWKTRREEASWET
jgi:hypothetical protein